MPHTYREHPTLTCRAVAGELVPVQRADESDEIVWFALPGEPDGSQVWEGLRASRRGNGETAQIRAIPLFAYDLNFGDEVSVIASAEGSLVAVDIVADGGNFTFRIWREDGDEAELRRIVMEFAEMGCLVESYSSRLLGLSCNRKMAQGVADRLHAGEQAGRFVYETGRQRTH